MGMPSTWACHGTLSLTRELPCTAGGCPPRRGMLTQDLASASQAAALHAAGGHGRAAQGPALAQPVHAGHRGCQRAPRRLRGRQPRLAALPGCGRPVPDAPGVERGALLLYLLLSPEYRYRMCSLSMQACRAALLAPRHLHVREEPSHVSLCMHACSAASLGSMPCACAQQVTHGV